MNKKFLLRVSDEEIVDTRKYRYIAVWRHYAENSSDYPNDIFRIDIGHIGTTYAMDFDHWEYIASVDTFPFPGRVYQYDGHIHAPHPSMYRYAK